ncbi:MAG TPA: metalloregulator ArsR/SmtB family transcription factor [Gemmatimonadaceae bacterium]|nr:metalloregulator ArsR/SmtB family transcription factor [Gemmatimonadaceae bacterium]
MTKPAPDTMARPTLGRMDVAFKGFADPTRIRILNVLSVGELCVCDIVDILRLPQPTVSRHLAYLRRAGLVDATRQWKFAHYRLSDPRDPVHASLLECVHESFSDNVGLARERRHAAARATARASEPC